MYIYIYIYIYNYIYEVDKLFFKIIFRKISFPYQIPDQNNTNLTKI